MSIPRTRASAVVVAFDHVLVVRLRDPVSGEAFSVVPGGLVEVGEEPAITAARETWEETGVRIVVDRASERVERYDFTWGGVLYRTTTHFFRAAPVDARAAASAPLEPGTVAPAYQLDQFWMPLAEAPAALSFHPEIWRATRALLDRA